ncbi:RibD family protein [Halomonas sp. GXIMD04776]|uniref:RibD family protein n=1 Tax=Halomonas sp. GXIMD04776 TaxID=3415605 RepID=UPI003C8D0DFC
MPSSRLSMGWTRTSCSSSRTSTGSPRRISKIARSTWCMTSPCVARLCLLMGLRMMIVHTLQMISERSLMCVSCLDIDTAWHLLCLARDHDWSSSRPFVADESGLRVLPGGVWTCRASVTDEVRYLFDSLLPLVARVAPLAIAQLGQSLDGRIATQSGASHYINGLESRIHLHRLRALVDAVVVGAGTVEADDPQLNVRHVQGRHPVRVVLDPRGRLGSARHVFQSNEAPTLHVVGEDATATGTFASHVERIVLPVGQVGFDPRRVLETLSARGLERVLIEGGGVTISRFLEAGVLNRLHMLIAPLLIGSGRPGLDLTPIATLDQALRPRARTFPCGEDTLFDLLLGADEAPGAAAH